MLEFLTRIPEEAGDGSPVMVLLHGRGSHMGDLQGLTRFFPGVTILTPQAPHRGEPWGYGPGWAWYRYMGGDRPDRDSLEKSLEALETFLAELPSHLGFSPGPLVLGGFSQGGTTSLAFALTRPGTVDGVVNLSGFLAEVDGVRLPLDPLEGTPVFWAHGNRDPAVPFELALKGWEAIRAAGGRLEAEEFPIGHWVAPEELQALGRWLQEEVEGWASAAVRVTSGEDSRRPRRTPRP